MTTYYAPTWIAQFLGLPFERGADGPSAYDCYGIVRAALREGFGVEAPPLDAQHLRYVHGLLHAGLAPSDTPWRPVSRDEIAPGDVLVFQAEEPHVGLVVAPDWMLHSRQDVGVEHTLFRRPPWWGLLVGCRRHRDLGP